MRNGDVAPDFTLTDQDGVERTLSELVTHGPVVLFFYPSAMTKGCTMESCHFRDLAAEFDGVGAQRIGISADTVDRQSQFTAKHEFGFPLLSDPDHKVAELYGVRRWGPSFMPNRRATFVIGSDGVLKDVISSEFNMNVHADRALQALRGA